MASERAWTLDLTKHAENQRVTLKKSKYRGLSVWAVCEWSKETVGSLGV
jgi:hypothetical protein